MCTRGTRGEAVWVNGPNKGVPGAHRVELFGHTVQTEVYPGHPGAVVNNNIYIYILLYTMFELYLVFRGSFRTT